MWLLFACSPDPVLEGDCQLDPDNVIRGSCSFQADPAGPVTLTLTPEGGGETLTLESSSGELPLWRMRAETRYAWVARSGEAELTGTLETKALPPHADLIARQEGEPPTSDTLFVVDCPQPVAIVLDREAQVVWYQELAAGLPEGDHRSVSLTFSEDDTLLSIVDNVLVREFALDGRLLLEIPYGDAATRMMHHDVFRRAGHTFVVTAHLQEVAGSTYIVDGVAAFDPDGTPLYDWDLSQLAEPSGEGALGGVYWRGRWPDALDWAHLNGFYVDTDLDLILSLHAFSTVVRLEGDPADPAFGTPVWVLDGSGSGPLGQDLALTDPDALTDDEVFGHQHHPQLLPDGTLQLFDNGEDVVDQARVLQLALDLEAGEAIVRGSYPVGEVCPIEGGAFVRPDGQVVATCAVRGTFYEISPEDGARLGSTQVTCPGNSGFTVIPRAIPVEIAP